MVPDRPRDARALLLRHFALEAAAGVQALPERKSEHAHGRVFRRSFRSPVGATLIRARPFGLRVGNLLHVSLAVDGWERLEGSLYGDASAAACGPSLGIFRLSRSSDAAARRLLQLYLPADLISLAAASLIRRNRGRPASLPLGTIKEEQVDG